jgi:hypothetical protein
MIQLRNYFRTSLSRIFPAPPLSLDCVEEGREFRICSVDSKPILRMLLYHGISDNQNLRVIRRDPYWVSVGDTSGDSLVVVSRSQARYIQTRKA